MEPKNKKNKRDLSKLPQKRTDGLDRLIDYQIQNGLLDPKEAADFKTTMMESLPISFRINFSKPCCNVEVTLKQIKALMEEFNQKEEIIQEITYFKKLKVFHIRIPHLEIRKNLKYVKLRTFLKENTLQKVIIRQEIVSMLPVEHLDIQLGDRVLDMCAAPGSKTQQIMDEIIKRMRCQKEPIYQQKGMVMANELSEQRAYILGGHTLNNDCPQIVITQQDANSFPFEAKFNKVLIDVPCSGDGTCRKNQALRKFWNNKSSLNLHRVQCQLIESGFKYLEKDGLMMYSTCSLNPLEDEAVVQTFLTKHFNDVEVIDIVDYYKKNHPEFRVTPGATNWKVKHVTKNCCKWFTTYEEVSEEIRKASQKMKRSLFPTKDKRILELLKRTIKVYPHHNNTGGFFLSLFRKKRCTVKVRVVDEEQKEESSLIGLIKEMTDPQPYIPSNPSKWDEFALFADIFPKVWAVVQNYYGITDPNIHKYLVCLKHSYRSIYLINDSLKQMLFGKKVAGVKIMKMGIKVFTTVKCHDPSAIQIRICQQGITSIQPFVTKRVVDLSLPDLKLFLESKVMEIKKERFSEEVVEAASWMRHGSLIGRVKHQSGQILISIWNGDVIFSRMFDKHYVAFFSHLFQNLTF